MICVWERSPGGLARDKNLPVNIRSCLVDQNPPPSPRFQCWCGELLFYFFGRFPGQKFASGHARKQQATRNREQLHTSTLKSGGRGGARIEQITAGVHWQTFVRCLIQFLAK